MAKLKNGKSRNDVKAGHPGERDVNPEAGKHGRIGVQRKNLDGPQAIVPRLIWIFSKIVICDYDQKPQIGNANHNIWRNCIKSICFPRRVEHLPAGSQKLLSLDFSGFLNS